MVSGSFSEVCYHRNTIPSKFVIHLIADGRSLFAKQKSTANAGGCWKVRKRRACC